MSRYAVTKFDVLSLRAEYIHILMWVRDLRNKQQVEGFLEENNETCKVDLNDFIV